MRHLLFTTSIIALAFSPLATQQSAAQTNAQQLGEGEITTLETWSYEPLYTDSLSVNALFDDFEVRSQAGDTIGSVENVIIDDEAQVLAIIAEVGGFWDIGDTHVSVPWDQVEVGDGSLTIPVTEANLDDYSIFGDAGFFYDESAGTITRVDDDLETVLGVFKATDLIGDYAYLTGDARYGYVYDLLIRDGQLTSVVVDSRASGGPGYYAYPYMNYGWGTGMHNWRYNLPYSAEDVTVIDTFDYSQMQYNMGGSADDES